MCEKSHTIHSAYLSIFVRGMGGGTWIHGNEKTNINNVKMNSNHQSGQILPFVNSK